MKQQILALANRLNWTKFNLETKNLGEILDIIKDGSYQLHDYSVGDYTLRDITDAIRKETDEIRQNVMKAAYLPIATFNGIWDGTRLSQYSNVTALDFDYIQTETESRSIMDALKTTPCVVAAFRTFKKHRLKVIILHDNNDPLKHKDLYEQLMMHFGLTFLDESCKDLSRKTFLAWDEDIWINPSPVAFHYEPTVQNKPVCQGKVSTGKKSKSPNSIINILNSSWRREHEEYWQKGNRATSIFKCACQFCEYGVPQDMAESYFINNWLDFDMQESEIRGHVNGAYHSAEFDSKIFY